MKYNSLTIKNYTMDNFEKKLFVLDTNVPLHDPFCLTKFAEHDIVIPIQLIEELDDFKNGHDTLNYNAREFLRILNELSGDHKFNGGVSLGENLGNLTVGLNRKIDKKIHLNLQDDTKIDNQILNLVFSLQKDKANINKNVILVSKDVNLRIKAKALGINAEDFVNETVKDIKALLETVQSIEVDPTVIDSLYVKKHTSLDLPTGEAFPNQNFVLKAGKKSGLVKFKNNNLSLVNKDKLSAFSLKPKNTEQAFALDALLDDDISLITIEGKAGTGKTILSLAAALAKLQANKYDEVLFSRQTISMGNREIGFLPGDVNDKIKPFMNGLQDNLNVLRHLKAENQNFISQSFEKIIIEPLAYIRGRSLHKVFFILDESQNLTPHEIKTIVTRAGEDSKFVFLGDIHQIDNPYLDERSNGFSYLMNKFRGQELYSHIQLHKSERSMLAELAGNLL